MLSNILFSKPAGFVPGKTKGEPLAQLDQRFWKSFPGWENAFFHEGCGARLAALAWHPAEEQPLPQACGAFSILAQGWHFKDM